MSSARELYERGVEAVNRGRHADARRLLERALALADEPDLVARILGSQAYLSFETGDYPAALTLFETALELPGTSPDARGTVHSQIGLVEMLRGDGNAALGAFDVAAELVGDPQVRARVHLNRGNVHLQRNQPGPAAADFTEAARQYRLAGDEYGAAKAEHNSGYSRLLEGDVPGALHDMLAAYETVASEGPVMRAMVEQDRAEALIAAGLVDEGVESLRAAAAAYAHRRLYQRQGEAELARARYERDPRRAREAARRAAERFRRGSADSWVARAEAEELAADVSLGRLDDAVERGDRIAAELDRHGLRWNAAAARLQAAAALVARGSLEAARARLRAIRVTGRAPLAVRLTDREVRAAAAPRSSRALAHVRTGLDDLHAWQSSFGSLDLQTNVVGHGVRLAVRGLALAAGSRSDAVLFEWSERARMLASRIQPVRAPQDPQTVADLAELRAGLAPEREAELRRRIRERAWQRKGSGEVADPVPLEQLQAGLGDDTALVAYVVTADRVVALVVTSAGTRRHELGGRDRLGDVLGGLLPDLDMAAAELPAALAGSVRSALARRLDAAAVLLVDPLLGDLGERRLVLTPSGVLAGMPWTLLPGLAGRPVVVAQSATSWLARTAPPLRARSAGLVAGPRVVRAEAEVRAAAAAWRRAPVLLGLEATAPAVSELAGRVDVLHVAAHGRHSAENPLFSGLELVGGPWFGYDIDQLPAVPDIVLLSACEVGRSTVRWGEELIGMTAAWLHAGARCVVASPAAVNDHAAHDALVRVHEALAGGADPASALAGTVAAVTPDAAPTPFLCFG
ncbi:MAG TPA: CHAT domain-containing protein [Nocardioides sp.]|uniref:CHAT domain-containing protein n=1 Tax=Nocardioides sp. TaxID=35761 RepID=UPI002E307F05|nr:CHAT domain-containing protein [Nocardioides sp.]HEX5087468.1 CHAT domain-containing protein [Nocardioides sp.]